MKHDHFGDFSHLRQDHASRIELRGTDSNAAYAHLVHDQADALTPGARAIIAAAKKARKLGAK